MNLIFKNHHLLGQILLQEVPDILLNIFHQVSLHLKYAYESLYEGRSSRKDESHSLYSVKEAKIIAEMTAKLVKFAIESEIVFFMVMECSQMTEFMSKSSTLMNSRDFSRLAMVLIEEEEKLRQMELKSAAAVIIQSFWRYILIRIFGPNSSCDSFLDCRSILQRRKWIKLRTGFMQLQKLYRKKLQSREGDLWKEFRASERRFNLHLNALKEKRKMQEKLFESIRKTPSSQLNLLYSREKEEAALKIQDYWRHHKDSTLTETSKSDIQNSVPKHSEYLFHIFKI